MLASAGESESLVRDVLLRDGSTLRLQAPRPVDFDDIKEFFDGLSPESRYLRFHGFGRTDTAARAAAEAGGVDRVALIARHDGLVVAVAGFDGLREPRAAEVSFAVADDDQRRGIGMRMLEQLAEIAAERGVNRFDAEVMFGNRAMLGVLEGAGFAVRRRGSSGELTVSLDITPTEAVQERIEERDHFAVVASLRPILAPSSVAVVGAAATPGNLGGVVLANIVAGGFEGAVAPVGRAGGVVCSMPVARSLAELKVVPELVIIAAAGGEVLEFAAEAASLGARGLLVLPAGPEDDGEASPEREERLLEIVRGSGLRMVGPSSLAVLNTAAEGAFRDPDLGSVIAVGLGGRLAGLGETVAFRLPPATDIEADELIDSCEGVAAQLDGFRGAAALHRAALRELILRFALLLGEVPELVEADLNPVRCTTNGCVVLGLRLRIERRRPLERVKTW